MAGECWGGGWAIYNESDTFREAVEYFDEHGYLSWDEGGSVSNWPTVDQKHNYFKIPWGGHRKLGRKNVWEVMLEPAVDGYAVFVYTQDLEAFECTADGHEWVDMIEWWADSREDRKYKERSEYTPEEVNDIEHWFWEEYVSDALKMEREAIEILYHYEINENTSASDS